MADPKIKFRGDATGAFLNGIPARDLTAEDYDGLDTATRAAVRDSPLYDYAGYKARLDAAATPAIPPSDPPKGVDKPADPPQDQTPVKGS